MNENSLTEFAAGSVTGERVFHPTKDGWLTGVTFEMIWKPGINEAVCCATGPLAPLAQVWSTHPWDREVFPMFPSEHRVGGLNCVCGFYAYYDGGDNRYSNLTTIPGIIRGHGITSIGDRGFRCQRAEIVALVRPRYRFRSALTGSRFLPMWMTLSAIVQVLMGTLDFTSGNPKGGWWAMLLAMVFMFSAIISVSGTPMLVGKWRKIKKHYPDVPIYRSMQAARAAHPLTDKSDYARGKREE